MSNKCLVRFAKIEDIPAIRAVDSWPAEQMLKRKIAAQEIIILEADKKLVGIARYAVLWTTVPFLGLIWIEKAFRGAGNSRKILDFLCDDLREQGYSTLLSSSQTDEPEPQAWHRKMGFSSNGIIENIADDNIGEVVFRLVL